MKLTDATAIRVGGTAATKVYLGATQVWPATAPGAASATLTIPAGKVASTLTNFVTRVDLGHMPSSWWAALGSNTGGMIRVKSAGTVIPFDVVNCAPALKMGEVFFKATLTTGANTFTIEVVPGATALAVTDANGRNAVWSDYDHVVLGPAYTVNRTGGPSPSVVGTMPLIGPIARSPHLGGHQGVAKDAAGNWYLIDTDAIKKFDANWNLLTTRSSANAATGISGVDHLSDGHVYNGELYVLAEKYPNTTWNNQHITVWNLSDLSFNRSYNISAQAHEASAICFNPADGYFYVTAYEGTGSDTTLYKYSTTGTYIGTLTTPAIASKQGIVVWDGYFWISYDPPSSSSDRIYRLTLDGATATYAASTYLGTTSTPNIEGLEADADHLYAVYDNGTTDQRVYTFERQGDSPRIHFDGRGYLKTTGLPMRSAWTVGATGYLSKPAIANRAFVSLSTNATVNTTRETLGAQSGGKYGLWNSTDLWLSDVGAAPAGQDYLRLHATHDGTVERKIWRGGALSATDTGTAARPSSPGDTRYVGAEDNDNNEGMVGSLERICDRNGVLTAAWIAAEYASWETPASFYTVT